MTRDTAYSKDQAQTYDSDRFSDKKGKKIHDVELSILLSAAQEIPKHASVLEVGCGTGRLLREMCVRGYKVDGLDASPHMLAECRQKSSGDYPDPRLVLGECGNIPFDDNTYDFVYTIRLLNQTESAAYALSSIDEMIRVAKPGSYVLVEFFNFFRPRIPWHPRRDVRLRPHEVCARARQNGAAPVWTRGAFFFGMTAVLRVPNYLVEFITTVDRFASLLFPRLCARCYVLMRK